MSNFEFGHHGVDAVKAEGLEGASASNTHIKITNKDGSIEFIPKSLDCSVSLK